MGPVWSVVYVVDIPGREGAAFMFLFDVLGASSNRIVLIQEHSALSG
jgi:hypothetical protein